MDLHRASHKGGDVDGNALVPSQASDPPETAKLSRLISLPMTTLARRIREFFAPPEDPINLAVFRAVVFFSILWAAVHVDISAVARQASDFRVPPPGYGDWVNRLPLDEGFLLRARFILVLVSLTGLLGVWTRTSAAIACIVATYLLGAPNLFGKVDHLHHHLIWFAGLLAVSKTDRVLSIDAWRQGPAATDRPASALPIRFAWLLIGVAYFFAGVAKLAAGPGWVFSDNLRNLLYLFWAEKNFIPPIRIDHFPLLCRFAALSTIAFEIGFLPSLFAPQLRRIFVLIGVLFHASNFFFLRINFSSLVFSYLIFVDWGRWWRARFPLRSPSNADEAVPTFHPDKTRPYAVVLVGTVLLLLNTYCGFLGISSWPFSVYPRFAEIHQAPIRSTLELRVESPTGTRPVAIPMPMRAMRRILTLPEGPAKQSQLENLRDPFVAAAGGLTAGERLRLYSVKRSTVPEEHNRSLGEATVLLEFTGEGDRYHQRR